MEVCEANITKMCLAHQQMVPVLIYHQTLFMAKYTALTANSSITYIVYMYSVQFSYSKANLNSTVTSISSDHDFQYPLGFFYIILVTIVFFYNLCALFAVHSTTPNKFTITILLNFFDNGKVPSPTAH